MEQSTILDKLINFSHWELVAIPALLLFIIPIALEMTGLIKPFSISFLSEEQKLKIHNRPYKKKLNDFLWFMNLVTGGILTLIQESFKFPKFIGYFLMAISIIRFFMTKELHSPRELGDIYRENNER